MKDKIRIGMIGVGQIGKHHLNNYQKIEAAEVVAIADINEAEARRVSELYHIPTMYTDFRELLKRDEALPCPFNRFPTPRSPLCGRIWDG